MNASTHDPPLAEPSGCIPWLCDPTIVDRALSRIPDDCDDWPEEHRASCPPEFGVVTDPEEWFEPFDEVPAAGAWC